MPRIANFKLLFSSSSFSTVAVTNPFKPALPSSRAFVTLATSYGREHRRRGGGGCGGGRGGRVFPPRRSERGVSTERREKERGSEMEREGMAGFNRKRAEGRDGGMKKNLQLKVRKLNPVNTICYVQILGTGMDTQDTSPSVLLFFDKQRIIFNAGEGLQRFCTEHKIKLSKVDHMFLTRVCSETAGGLPGLLLTLAGIGEEGMSVNIWGPSDLNYLVEAMRSFIPNAAMVHTHSFGETTNGDVFTFSSSKSSDIKSINPIVLIDDEVVKVSAILLPPRYPDQSTDKEIKSHIANLGSLFSAKSNSFAGSGSPKKRVAPKPGDIAVIYSCELPEIKGKFDPSKAASLGLRPGPKYRELQMGKSVLSDSGGVLVHSSDVLGPSIPGPIVLLVDCPTPSHLVELLTLQSLNCYYVDSNDQEGAKSVNCIIHLGPAAVTKSADYQNWMRRFGGAQHIMAGHKMENVALPILKSCARITTRLNYICPHLFPSPDLTCSSKKVNYHLEINSPSEGSLSACCDSIPAENLLKFHLRPFAQLGLDRSLIPSVQTPKEIVSELLLEIPAIQEASKDVNELWHDSRKANIVASTSNESTLMTEEPWMSEHSCNPDTGLDPEIPTCLENISRKDMEIVLLGTGSSQPSKYRNVSSIYVNLFAKGSILFDCGEGTLGQLKRRFGVEAADEAVKALRLIWISHIHADHHTGLARILALRSELLRDSLHEPLLVVGPRPLKRFLDAYSRLEDLDMQFLDCRHTTEASWHAIEDSVEFGQDSSSELADVKDNDTGDMEKANKKLRNTIFGKCNQMQSYLKRPGSPVDTAVVLPVLLKLKKVLEESGLESLYSVPVVHCPQSFGIVLKATERMNEIGKVIPGWKLVYSGDTRPCQALVDASHGATVLIHEATFEDGLEEEALAKNHSTTMEAVNVGTMADAYRIILTHFSQRYPKIPVFDENHMSKTCIGFDMMSINAADLPVLPKVLPHLKLLFKDEVALDESDEAPALAMK